MARAPVGSGRLQEGHVCHTGADVQPQRFGERPQCLLETSRGGREDEGVVEAAIRRGIWRVRRDVSRRSAPRETLPTQHAGLSTHLNEDLKRNAEERAIGQSAGRSDVSFGHRSRGRRDKQVHVEATRAAHELRDELQVRLRHEQTQIAHLKRQEKDRFPVLRRVRDVRLVPIRARRVRRNDPDVRRR